jgi:hypothetical protein
MTRSRYLVLGRDVEPGIVESRTARSAVLRSLWASGYGTLAALMRWRGLMMADQSELRVFVLVRRPGQRAAWQSVAVSDLEPEP